MLVVQIVALGVSGAIAFLLSRSGRTLWRPIIGAIVGLPVGIICGVLVGGLLGDSSDLHIYSTSFWFASFGIIGGVIYGRRQRKQNDTSEK